MNSVHAIAGALSAGIGGIMGIRLFMREQLEAGTLHARPIVEPTLLRTLHLCRLFDRPATFVMEAMRRLLLDLIRVEIRSVLSATAWVPVPRRTRNATHPDRRSAR